MLDEACLRLFLEKVQIAKADGKPIKLRAANLLHQMAKASFSEEIIANTIELPAILCALGKENGFMLCTQDKELFIDEKKYFSQKYIESIITLLQPLSMQLRHLHP